MCYDKNEIDRIAESEAKALAKLNKRTNSNKRRLRLQHEDNYNNTEFNKLFKVK